MPRFLWLEPPHFGCGTSMNAKIYARRAEMCAAITKRAVMSPVPPAASIARSPADVMAAALGKFSPHQFQHMRRFRTGNPVWHRRRNAASGRRVDCSTVSFFELALNVENDVLRGRRSSQSMGIVRSCLVLFPADDRTPIEVATV